MFLPNLLGILTTTIATTIQLNSAPSSRSPSTRFRLTLQHTCSSPGPAASAMCFATIFEWTCSHTKAVFAHCALSPEAGGQHPSQCCALDFETTPIDVACSSCQKRQRIRRRSRLKERRMQEEAERWLAGKEGRRAAEGVERRRREWEERKEREFGERRRVEEGERMKRVAEIERLVAVVARKRGLLNGVDPTFWQTALVVADESTAGREQRPQVCNGSQDWYRE